MLDGWNAAVALTFPDREAVPPYVLRHSSIIRWLRHGVSGEIVADLHDTSEEMLRQTYAAELSGKAERGPLGWEDIRAMGRGWLADHKAEIAAHAEPPRRSRRRRP
jgi:hypothetical protein